jgi:hypothetical protein
MSGQHKLFEQFIAMCCTWWALPSLVDRGARSLDARCITQEKRSCLVFNQMHAVRVHLLRQAKALSDVLIVGTNNESHACRLKGAGRPISRERLASRWLLRLI